MIFDPVNFVATRLPMTPSTFAVKPPFDAPNIPHRIRWKSTEVFTLLAADPNLKPPSHVKQKYSTGPELLPPESDRSLATYVRGGYEFTGVTHIELRGSSMSVTNAKGETETLSWPKNGLIYIKDSEEGCGYKYVTQQVRRCLRQNPKRGTATLGLIASDYVRIYHPLTASNCSKSTKNETGSLSNPWIYAAILSTSHSFVVDNHNCGDALGKLHIYGAITQRFLGTTGGTGYIKDYKYDERLAVDEPPYFLNPIDAGWEVERETAPEGS